MIETPSLRTRVAVITIGVITVLVLALDGFVYLSLQDRLEGTLYEVLDARVTLVERLAEEVADPVTLDAELASLGIPAVVTVPGQVVADTEPVVRAFDRVPPALRGEASTVSRVIPLSGGASIEVFVSRGGVDSTLHRVLVIEVIGSAAAIALALALLYRAAAVITRPLDRMVDTAREIAGGDLGRRLDPADPHTELGRMATAFDQMIDALDRAVTEAREAETRSRRFLANAAHQLRTPLAGLKASAETFLAHPEGPDRDHMAAAVTREATRLSRLVASLLYVARLDRGEPLDRHPTDLVALVTDEVGRQRELAPRIAFDVTARGDVPVVSCDPHAVREALANLLDNARRFAGTSVTVGLEAGIGTVQVDVIDDGPGVPCDAADSVFDRFWSSDGGSGLGLSIARGIVQNHGGDLVLRDGRFEMTIPMAAWDGV